MKKNLTKFLFVCSCVFLLTFWVSAQDIVTTKSASELGKCDGVAKLTTKQKIKDWYWQNADAKLLQKSGDMLDSLCAGKYAIVYFDSLGNKNTFDFAINTNQVTDKCAGFSALIKQTVNNTGKAPNCNGMLTAGVYGGTAPFTFTWVNVNNASTQTVQGLCGGKYYLTVKDSNNCSSTISGTITDPSDSTVVNKCDGFKVEVAGFSNNKQGAANCVGFIETKLTGGKKPFMYSWTNGAKEPYIKGLCATKYGLTVKDSNGCIATLSKEIGTDSTTTGTNPCTEFKIEFVKAANDKAGDTICTGGIVARAIGGKEPFNFEWNNGVKTPYLEGVCAGVYSLTAKDANNCYAAFKYEIKAEQVVKIDSCAGFKIELVKFVNDQAGDSICTGAAVVNAVGGKAPFTYIWSNGAKSNYNEKLCAGSYNAYAIDANNCKTYVAVTIKADTTTSTKKNCAGFITNLVGMKNTLKGGIVCSGYLVAGIVGGQQPYTYYWSTGAKDLAIKMLCTGKYAFKAIDANGCISSFETEVKEEVALDSNKCAGFAANIIVKNTQAGAKECNGAMYASVTGGKEPYAFLWTNNKTDKYISGLCAGVFGVKVTDANGCAVKMEKYVGKDSIIQNPCAGLFANVYVINAKKFEKPCTGALVANVGGGKAPYKFKWSDGSNLPALKNVCEGSYTLTVMDSANCAITIEKYVGLDSVVNPCANFYAKISGVENCGLNAVVCNGSLATTVVGGKAPYDFSWNTGAKSPSITNLCAGQYSVEVVDANKCHITLDGKVYIDSTKNACAGFFTKVVSVKNDKAGDNECTGEIKTETVGGTAPYAFYWSNGNQSSSATKLCAGNYYMYVKDKNGCINKLEKFVGSDSIVDNCKGFYAYVSKVVDYSEDDATCAGKLEVAVKGGKAPFTYTWSTGATTNAIADLCADGYSVLVKDANNCEVKLSAKITKLPSKKVTLKAKIYTADATNASNCDGAMKIQVEGGVTPYSFYHSNGEVGQYRTNVCPGVYTVIVKDAKGDVIELKYLISAPTNVIDNKNDSLKGKPVADTVKSSITKECAINFNAIDSIKIVNKAYKKDTLVVTWAVYNANTVVYVTDAYVFTKGKGVYKIKLDLYCDEVKQIGNYVSVTENVMYESQVQAASVNELNSLEAVVYPNPFSDKVSISLDKVQDYKIQVIDMSGKELFNSSYANTNAISLNLGHLVSGHYLVKIVSETSSFTRMIAK